MRRVTPGCIERRLIFRLELTLSLALLVLTGCGPGRAPRPTPSPKLPAPAPTAAYVENLLAAAKAAAHTAVPHAPALKARVDDIALVFVSAAQRASEAGDPVAAAAVAEQWRRSHSSLLALGLTGSMMDETTLALSDAVLEAGLYGLQEQILQDLPRTLRAADERAAAQSSAERVQAIVGSTSPLALSGEAAEVLEQTLHPLRSLLTSALDDLTGRARSVADQGMDLSSFVGEMALIQSESPALCALFPVECDQAAGEIRDLDRGLRVLSERLKLLVAGLPAAVTNRALEIQLEAGAAGLRELEATPWAALTPGDIAARTGGARALITDRAAERIASLRREAILAYGAGGDGSAPLRELLTFRQSAPHTLRLVEAEMDEALAAIRAAAGTQTVEEW